MLRHAPVMSCRPNPTSSWFRSPEGRRYIRHFGALIVLKIALLATLYFVFIAPQPRANTAPDRVYDAIRGAPAAATVPAAPPSDSTTPREPTP